MAFDPLYKMTIQNATGQYLLAAQSPMGTWTVFAATGVQYLETLPQGWDDTTITWERNLTYYGIFRSMSNGQYKFTKDARAIIQSLRQAAGINAYGLITIWIIDFTATSLTYNVFYQTQLDFTTYSDNMLSRMLSIGLLDSQLMRDLDAYGDTVFNIPIWAPGSIGSWVPYNNNVWVVDDGVKLLYSASYTNSCSPGNPLQFGGGLGTGPGSALAGFFKGRGGPHTIPSMAQYNITQNNGATTFIGNDILQQFLIQGNQTSGSAQIINEVTFAGINNSQPWTRSNYSLKNAIPAATNGIKMTVNFSGTFAPYNGVLGQITNIAVASGGGGYLVGDAFVIGTVGTTGATAYGIVTSIGVGGVVTGAGLIPNSGGAGYTAGTSYITSGGTGTGLIILVTAVVTGLNYITVNSYTSVPLGDSFIGFAIFEIQNNDIPTLGGGGNYQYGFDKGYGCVAKWQIPIAIGGGGGSATYNFPSGASLDFNLTELLTVNPNCVYIFCLIVDGNASSLSAGDFVQCGFSNLVITFESDYDYGASGVPIPAPTLNPSCYAGYRLYQLLNMLTDYLASRTSNIYGFPTQIVPSPYTAISAYLSNPALPLTGDGRPYNTVITSAYCIHDLEGQAYISLSMNQLYDFCRKVWGCGMGIIGNTLTMENLGYYFDGSTMTLDLGYNVTDFEIDQSTNLIGANLKLGYQKADTNTDFGVDSFITELFYNTPAAQQPGIMDWEEDSITVDQYEKEKARAQQVAQPVGTSYDPANPSQDNTPYAVYCCDAPIAGTLPYNVPGTIGYNPALSTYDFQPYDPGGSPIPSTPPAPLSGIIPYRILMYNGVNNAPGAAAQNYDPTAGGAPYINGLYYPDSAQNVPLSPCRALQRDGGALLNSVLDKMNTEYLTFRATGVMQYNNVSLALNGIESNLEVGAGAAPITEMKDILIGTLPNKLFLQTIIKVRATTKQSLYTALNSNPNGYVRFFWPAESIGSGAPAFTEYHFFITKVQQQPTNASGAGNGNIALTLEGWAAPSNPAIGYVSPV